jgi:D-mannonate dehydratase
VGTTGIVTALHEVPTGTTWTSEAMAERKCLIKADRTLSLRWSVVESIGWVLFTVRTKPPIRKQLSRLETGA